MPLIRRTTRALLLAALLALPTAALRAQTDDIAAAIEEAGRAYRANDFAAAKAALDNATRLLGERSNATLSRFLPAPPEGWTAGEIETDASAAERFGGGLIAKRRYTHGTREATVLVIAHSPLIRQLAPLFAHSQLLSTVGRVFRVNGKTAVRTRDGKIQVLLGRTLVMIEGSANEQEKRALLELIDLAAIEKFNS
jgi:hypothetical protein